MSRPANDISIEHTDDRTRFKLHFLGVRFYFPYPRYKRHGDIEHSIKQVVRTIEHNIGDELSVAEYGTLTTLLVEEYKRHFNLYRRHHPDQPFNSVNTFGGEEPSNKRDGGRVDVFGLGGSKMADDTQAVYDHRFDRMQSGREEEIKKRVLAETMHLLKRREAWKKQISDTEAKHNALKQQYMDMVRAQERQHAHHHRDRSRRELEMEIEDIENGLPGQPIHVRRKHGGRIKKFI
jgi:hypothetical protein